MKKSFLILKFLLVLFVVGLATYVILYFKDIRAFQGVLASYHSHLFCSCRYVMKQGEDFCADFARQYLPISSYTHESENQRVTTRALGVERTAEFVNSAEGCILK
jgi:hypothetical protein